MMTTPTLQERLREMAEQHFHDAADALDALASELAAAQEALAQYRCPINLDGSPEICSAGSCYKCVVSRLKAAQERIRELEDTTCNAEQLRQEREARQRAEALLERAFTEMRKQYPAITAVFDREIWDIARKP